MMAGRNITYKESRMNNARVEPDTNYNIRSYVRLEKKRGSFPLCRQLFIHSKLQEVLSMLTNAAQQVASGGNLQTF